MKKICCLLMVLGVSVVIANATTVIYQDDFSGSSSLLNGQMPDVGGTAWSANAGFYRNGNIGGADGSAVLPFVPQVGKIYELTAELAGTTGVANWFGIGFTTNAPASPTASNGADRFSNSGGYSWLLYRDPTVSADLVKQVTFIQGKNAVGASYLGHLISDVEVFHSFKIVLDTTAAIWTTQMFLDGVSISNILNLPATAATDIKYVGITASLNAFAAGTGSIDNFVLAEVPEPATMIILCVGTGFAFFRRK